MRSTGFESALCGFLQMESMAYLHIANATHYASNIWGMNPLSTREREKRDMVIHWSVVQRNTDYAVPDRSWMRTQAV
jgi:hypothetical protein